MPCGLSLQNVKIKAFIFSTKYMCNKNILDSDVEARKPKIYKLQIKYGEDKQLA